MTLPLPVPPIRFWAALWLFILGTVAYSPDVTGSGAGVLSVVFFEAATLGAGFAGASGAAVSVGSCGGAVSVVGSAAALVGSGASVVGSVVAAVISVSVAASRG